MSQIKIIASIYFLCFGVILAVIENESTTSAEWYYFIYDDDNGTSLLYNTTYDDEEISDVYNVTDNDNTIYNQIEDSPFLNELIFQINQYCRYVVTVIGIPGNLLICIAILKYKYIQSAPNVYVFSLAVSDILGICSRILIFNEFDAIIRGLVRHGGNVLLWTSNLVTVWTTVGITVDRYIALCHPFLARSYSSLCKAKIVNISIWILFLLFSYFRFLYLMTPWMYNIIAVLYNNPALELIFFFMLPLCIIIVLYICIVLSIRKSSQLRESCNIEGQSMTGRSLKISVAIVVQFIVCWGPRPFIFLLLQFSVPLNNTMCFFMIDTINLLCTIIDPIVYAVISMKYRKAFKDILCLDCCEISSTAPM